ncbi:MAG: glycosyltransferase [Planctomycetota bacterium]|nr:glycosyltransferase [Planctomycetota bacterium]
MEGECASKGCNGGACGLPRRVRHYSPDVATHDKHRLIQQLLQSGKAREAHTAAMQLASKSPKDAGAMILASSASLDCGELVQAEFYMRRAMGILPGDPSVLMQAAHVLSMLNKSDEAYANLRSSLAASKGLPAGGPLLAAQILARTGRHFESLAMSTAGLSVMPGDASLRLVRAQAMLECGEAAMCVDELRQLMLQRGDDVQLCSLLCNALNYDPRVDPQRLRMMHTTFGRIVSRHRPQGLGAFAGLDRSPDRKLRVGVLSPDLRSHSCAFFIEPFFEHHDREQLELHAYHTSKATDGTTQRLKGHAAAFRNEWHISDQKLAELIRKDKIDVLIELSGHTRGGSLVAVHLKAAPVQLTYLGYPNITGLDAVDARLVDSITDPAGTDDAARKAEALVRMDPCFLCFKVPEGLPATVPPESGPEWVPGLKDGSVTFGSCNAVQKLNGYVIELWTKLVKDVPGARLLLKAANLREPALRERIRAKFIAAGLAAEQIEVVGPIEGREDHLAFYQRIDVALDPFPYNGTTTTCDALLMGVPVVTLAGSVHASRVGASLLHAVGHGEWVASDPEQYLAIASGLAADRSLRATLRTALRDQVRGSVLCDEPAFGRRMSEVIRQVWRSHACLG